MKLLQAEHLVGDFLGELYGRSGFDDWWDSIDPDIREEIAEKLVDIARGF